VNSHPLYFLRHGETAWNLERRLQGQRDIELNATGHMQAKAMAEKLAEILPDPSQFDFHVSPLSRTRQTMAYVQNAYGIGDDALTIDDRLQELNFGDFEGMMWSDVDKVAPTAATDPEAYHDWQPNNGESYVTAAKRVAAWYGSLSGPTIVVSHGGISRILRGLVLKLSKREIVQLKVPQNKFYRLAGGGIDWFDAS
jgi:broad specificity phosphatase PhoE